MTQDEKDVTVETMDLIRRVPQRLPGSDTEPSLMVDAALSEAEAMKSSRML